MGETKVLRHKNGAKKIMEVDKYTHPDRVTKAMDSVESVLHLLGGVPKRREFGGFLVQGL